MSVRPHVLILGGTSEAGVLAAMLALRPELSATLSLAGRTRNPVSPAIRLRVGGFGGADGLAAWMRSEGVTALVDATHPFARNMPFNAARAARASETPLLALTRPAWRPDAGDRWAEVADHSEVIEALGPVRRRVFLTVGRHEIGAYRLAPHHHYVVRSVEPVGDPGLLPDAVWLTARGPFALQDEYALIVRHGIDVIVTKNSGGDATEGKLRAARLLGLPAILLRRPPRPDGPIVPTVAEALAWIERIHGVSASGRGV